jgi:hypothetical protein
MSLLEIKGWYAYLGIKRQREKADANKRKGHNTRRR